MFSDFKDEVTKVLGGKSYTARRAMIALIVSPIIFVWALLMIVIGDWDANANLFNKWLNPNTIDVVSGESITKNDISIQWKTDMMSDYIDLYKNGETVFDEFREQEDNYFNVRYRGEIIARFDQFKKKGVYGHHYYFFITKPSDRLQVKLLIEGRDTTFVRLQ